MFLPNYSETQIASVYDFNPCGGAGNVGGTGVPSLAANYAWITTAFSNSSSNYWIWSGATGSNATYNNSVYVRCVR